MAPTLKYRDPGDGTFKLVEGSPGPTGPVGDEGPTGPAGVATAPIGSIIMFGGSVAPAGWHLCDGTAHGSSALQTLLGSANTPNLEDKFVLAAGATHAAKATGGAATVTLTAAQSGRPSHTHTATRSHTHSVDPPNVTSGAMSAGASHNHATGDQGGGVMGTAYGLLKHGGDLRADGGQSTYYYIMAYSQTTTSMSLAHTHTIDFPAFNTVTATPAITINTVTAANATGSHENMPPFWALTYIIRKA